LTHSLSTHNPKFSFLRPFEAWIVDEHRSLPHQQIPHRRGRAFVTATARWGSTAQEMLSRTPRPISDSISGRPAGAAGGVGPSVSPALDGFKLDV